MDKELALLLLQQTKKEPFIIINELEEATTAKRVTNLLEELLKNGFVFQKTIDNNYQITREQRARLAILWAKNGIDFDRIIKELSWQEFEILTTIVGDEFGYESKTGLSFSTSERKYQIDVILKNKPYVLLIDCKHFGGTGKKSILKKAAEDQLDRIHAVKDSIDILKHKINVGSWKTLKLTPVIITWLDDELFFYEQVPIVPFTKFHSFLQNFYLYFEDISILSINLSK
ncbi:MAG: hypothetical protein JXA54_17050 [Candidatus Heimdallarchaeota archaeon]|nr:hypothetical protein [Candidatus Heimdallarchaeota archaeon]